MSDGQDRDAGGRARRIDAAAAGLLMAVAAAFFSAAWREPVALYDPLGPGTAPLWVSVFLFAMAALLFLRSLRGLAVGQSSQSLILGLDGAQPEDYRLRPDLAAIGYLATAAYAGSIAIGLPFLWSTMAFLAGLGCALADFRPRPSAWAIATGIAGALAIDHLFRRILLVNLP